MGSGIGMGAAITAGHVSSVAVLIPGPVIARDDAVRPAAARILRSGRSAAAPL
jgi:hypothetical protein